MQLASSGAKAFTGRQTSHIMGNPSRSIHIPSFIPRPTPKPSGSTVQTLFKQTRTLLSRFASQLTSVGGIRRAPGIPSTARSLHSAPARTIQQGLSLPARYALGRPLYSAHLPRAPSVPRGVAQVGLGTARNFSTGRPIFQNLVENVPITGRAFWEADWEIRMQEEKERMRPKKYRKSKENKGKGKEMLKLKQDKVVKVQSTEETRNTELDHYFPATSEPEVTTFLLIPLAPTPTSRLPLPVSPPPHSSTHPLLPFSIVSSVHANHTTHALRVSTLFARLDSSHVFDEIGVECSAYGDPSGLCTVLEVRFTGWTESRVRSVLGEAGTGWCVIEEVWKDQEVSEKEAMDEVLSSMSTNGASTPAHVEIDPSSSFVLPTLDLSASFPAQSTVWSSPPPSAAGVGMSSTALSDFEFHNTWTSAMSDGGGDDALSDVLSDLDSATWSDDLFGGTTSRRSSSGSESWIGLGFSSQFAGRVHGSEVPEPRELMF